MPARGIDSLNHQHATGVRDNATGHGSGLASNCQPIQAIDHVGHIAVGTYVILGADLILGVLLSRGLAGRGQLLGLAMVAGGFLWGVVLLVTHIFALGH